MLVWGGGMEICMLLQKKITRKGKKKNECEEETKKVDCHVDVCGDGAGVHDGGTGGKLFVCL